MRITRFPTNPIITPDLDERIGTNINGPSLIRAPEWLPNRLGNYYLYFGHHQGKYIRLAYADDLTGPWQVYTPGTLHLEETPCYGHIASPDVHVDEANRRLVMYYHGPALNKEQSAADPTTATFPIIGGQRTFVATSTDGIHFASQTEVLGSSYFRVFTWQGWTYALGMPGLLYRSQDGFTDFKRGPILFNQNQRHTALLRRDEQLFVFYSEAGDCPEHIKVATLDLRPDWLDWQAADPTSVLMPELEYEGVGFPLIPSERGSIHEPVRQLRDPGIFVEDEQIFLLYSVAGESGLAIAELAIENS